MSQMFGEILPNTMSQSKIHSSANERKCSRTITLFSTCKRT